MRPIDRPVSEDDLHAYVDGRLAPEDRSRIADYLDEHPEAAARVHDWTRSGDLLRRALASKAEEPLPSALQLDRLARARRARHGSAPWQMAAAIALALLVGSGAGWMARGTDTPRGLAGLSQQAALVQRVFAADTHLVDFTGTDKEQRVGFAGRETSRPVTAPDLSKAGYTLIGGRLVATEQGSAPMFVYQNGQGGRVSVFVRLMVGIDTNAPMRPVEAEGASGYAWSHNGVGFSLIAAKPEPALKDLSDQVRDEMDART